MSAWIVSKKHIDALVTGAIEMGFTTNPDILGQALWDENYRSINSRYNGNNKAPVYHWEKVKLSPISLLKQLHCYDYQTCEAEDYQDTFSGITVNTMIKALAGRLGGNPDFDPHKLPGWDEIPWGI